MKSGKVPQLAPPGDEAIVLDKDYMIVSVEEFKSEVQGFMGWRVLIDGGSEDIIAIPLWVGDVVGRSSKMGTFMEALGPNPDSWNGRTIQFARWVDRDRKIRLVK